MTLPPKLRSKQGIEKWANRYPYREWDRKIRRIVQSALERRYKNHAGGYLTKEDLLEIGEWKSGCRNIPRLKSNQDKSINEASHWSFTTGKHEFLECLDGIGLPTASAIMHFAFPEKYPIIDIRALNALGAEEPSSYDSARGQEVWYEYKRNCLTWARKYGVSLRTLDRALWQYGKKC